MKATSWLQRDSYATLVRRLQGLALDYGNSFVTELARGPNTSSLKVHSCLYQQVFEAEGLPQLTSCCCCTQDRVWLEGATLKGVHAGLQSSIADGDSVCCFVVHKDA
jgi:hypothetical protein